MVAANIRINGVTGSNDNVPIGEVVTLTNVNDGDESSWTWQILSQPSGTPDALSSTSGASVTFTPRREGSYLVKLVVDQGFPTRRENKVVVAVRYAKSFIRHPATLEETQVANTGTSVPGWQKATEDTWKRLDDMIQSTSVLVCVPSTDVSPGDVVRVLSRTAIKAGLPGAEYVPLVTPIRATSSDYAHTWVGLVEGSVDTTLSAPWNAIPVYVRFFGYSALEGTATGDSPHAFKLFLSDSGTVSRTPGVYRRRVGYAVDTGVSTFRILFDGRPCVPPSIVPVGWRKDVPNTLGWYTNDVFIYDTSEYGYKDLVFRVRASVTNAATQGNARVYDPVTSATAAILSFTSDVLAEEKRAAMTFAFGVSRYAVQLSLTGGSGSDVFTHWQSMVEVHQD